MTEKQGKSGTIAVEALLGEDEDYLRAMAQSVVEATLEAEMTQTVGAEKGARTV